jgi:hypothetical protein
MIAIFYSLRLLGVLLGLAVGLMVTIGASAWAGIAIGMALGISVGILAGRLPWGIALACLRLSLKRYATQQLRARIQRDYFPLDLIIAESVSRGESVEQFRGDVEALIRSDSIARRRCGKKCQRRWFPYMKL